MSGPETVRTKSKQAGLPFIQQPLLSVRDAANFRVTWPINISVGYSAVYATPRCYGLLYDADTARYNAAVRTALHEVSALKCQRDTRRSHPIIKAGRSTPPPKL
eukprot:977415-Rhodomonas_salina.3